MRIRARSRGGLMWQRFQPRALWSMVTKKNGSIAYSKHLLGNLLWNWGVANNPLMSMSTDVRHTTAADERVPWNQLIAYGMGGLIPIALFNIAPQLMGLLGNISLGLSAFWLGTIMIVPRLWDAFSDPVMGHISDNTRTRWGRRRPYVLLGGIVVAVSFVAIWWVPRGEWLRELLLTEAAYNWLQLAYILGGM